MFEEFDSFDEILIPSG